MIKPKTRNIETSENADPMKALQSKLKSCDPEIQNFVAALEKEMLKFQKDNAKLQAENVKLNGWITILEEDTNKRCVHETPPYKCIQEKLELIQKKRAALKEQLDVLKPKTR